MEWYICRLCKRAYKLKEDLILHKKKDHPMEYKLYKKERKKNKEKNLENHHDGTSKASPSTNKIPSSVHDGAASAADPQIEIKKETDSPKKNGQSDHDETKKNSSSFQNECGKSEEKPYKCEFCSKSYHKVTRLARHVEARHNSSKLLVTEKREKIKIITTTTTTTRVTSSSSSKKSQFRCKFCDKQLSSAQRLRGHEKIHSKSSPATTTVNKDCWRCTKCNMNFANSRLWTRHMDNHEDRTKKVSSSEDDEEDNEQDEEEEVIKNAQKINKDTPSQNNNNFDPDYKNLQKALYTAQCAPHLTTKMVEQKAKYYCNFCKKEFTNYSIALDHIPSHTKLRAFKCPICPKDYLYERDRSKHERLFRHGISSNDSPAARTTTKGEMSRKESPTKKIISSASSSLDNHRRTSPINKEEGSSSASLSLEKFRYRVIEGKKFYPCKLCPRIFPSIGQVRIHQTLHNSRNKRRTSKSTTSTSLLKYHCRICSKEYTNRPNCVAHERREHTGEKPYKCESCDSSFVSWLRRNVHYQKVHGSVHPEMKYGENRKITSSPSLPSSSSRSTPPVVKQKFDGETVFVCTACVKVFGDKDAVLAHVKSSHGVKEEDLLKISSSKNLSSSPIVDSSSNRQNNKNNNDNPQTTKDDDADKPYKCSYCPNRYMHRSTRSRHMRKAHQHSGGTAPAIKTNQNSPRSKFSSRNFRRRKSKYASISSRPSKCPICQRIYSSVHSMRRHYKIHTGEMPYKCREPDCGTVFRDQSSLRVHRLNYHGISANVPASRNSVRASSRGEGSQEEDDDDDEEDGQNNIMKKLSHHQQVQKTFKCSYSHICDKAFAYNANRIKHEQTHLRNRDRKTSTGVSTGHHRRRHVNTGKGSTIATKVSSDTYKSSPYISFRMDSDSKIIYSCNFCQKEFDRPSLAVIHTRSHTGEAPHECPCGKKFRNPSHCNRHRKVCPVSRSNGD